MLSAINRQFIKAAQNNQLDELKNLLAKGADLHANDDEALRYFIRKGHFEAVKFLVTQGTNIHADNDGAIRWSAANGHLETVKFLVTQGANIHANHDEALKNAASKNHNDVWQALSSFIQEEKLLVAALGSMPVLPEVASVALVAASDSMLLVAASVSTSASNCLRATEPTAVLACH